MNKKTKFLKISYEKIIEIENLLLEINVAKEEDFSYIIKLLNEIENATFFIGNISYVNALSILKKMCIYIEKFPEQYYNFKYNIYSSIISLNSIYLMYLENNYDKLTIVESRLNDNILKLKSELEKLNKNKEYYYIKIELNKEIKYFYLSRRHILIRFKEYGKAYNYKPLSLDDDRYNYFIMDYKVEKGFDVKSLLEELSKEDEAISNYSIYKIENNKNIYNLKIYFKSYSENNIDIIKKIFKDDILLDIIEYESVFDIYIYSNNQLEVIKILGNLENENIDLIFSKNINNRETRILAINGLNFYNIERIKKIIAFSLRDKIIVDILYKNTVDFYGKQFLEYIKEKYNIENVILNNK